MNYDFQTDGVLLLTCFAHDAILAQVLYVQASMSAHLGQL